MKYKKHPSINPIQNPFKNAGTIYSTELEKLSNIIEKEINKLNTKKACQNSHIPTKIIKENTVLYAEFL